MIDERSNKSVSIRMAVPLRFDTNNYINFRIFVSRMTARGDTQLLWTHVALNTHSLMYQKHTHFIECFWKQISSCNCETPSSIIKCLASLFFSTNSTHAKKWKLSKIGRANGYVRVFCGLCYVSGGDDVTAWSDFSRKEHISIQEVKHIERH